MNAHRTSLKRRLALMLVAPLIALGLLFLSQVQSSAKLSSDRIYDRVLLGSALAISERIIVGEENKLEVDLPYVALEMLASAAQDRVYYRVEGSGTSITGYGDLPEPALKKALLPGQPFYYDSSFRGANVRVVALGGAATGSQASVPFTVFVAETTQARQQLVRETVIASGRRIATTILAAVIIVWLGISWGLRPLGLLQEALARRTANDLRPIVHPVPREVSPLVEEVNQLMGRLNGALKATRTFTGNASHQLRTPLAVVKVNLEIANREIDTSKIQQAVSAAHRATSECQRLVEGLLLLAQLDGKEFDIRRAPLIDLNETAKTVAQELVPRAVKQSHELEFEAPEHPLLIRAEAALVSEAIKNLIENAILYCPRGSRIVVQVALCGNAPAVSVADNGPGIAADDYALAIERFAKLNGTSGTGLGLAITREIMLYHDAKLRLSKSQFGGLKAQLEFNAAK